jgi:hypothetical protein
MSFDGAQFAEDYKERHRRKTIPPPMDRSFFGRKKIDRRTFLARCRSRPVECG